MADEPNAAPLSEDTPTTEAPAEPDTPSTDTPESPDAGVNYQQRYEDLRPEFDRRNEVLATLEGRYGPEAQAQVLAQYGIELENDQPAPDPYDIPDPSEEVAQLRQEWADDKAAAEAAHLEQLEQDYIESTVEQLENQANLQLTDEEYGIVVNHGLSNRGPDGRPDLEGGFNALKAAQTAAQKRYADSKHSAVRPPTGATGEPQIDLRDKDARIKLAQEVFEANQQAQQA